MAAVDRRTVLKGVAATGAVAATGIALPAHGRVAKVAPPDAVGLLYDTTLCIGCKTCVVACREANDKKPDTRLSGGLWDMPSDLNGQTKNVIKLYKDPDSPERSYFKAQCMHCIDPACVGACMLGALQKREHGIVTYDSFFCSGCRYCQMVCPFEIPKFEWEKLAPKIVKCELCNHRLKEGKQPGCTEVCPRHAVIYGKRTDLLAEAKRRIAENPKKYKGYKKRRPCQGLRGDGGGGTQCLYLSHVPFEKLGLPTCRPSLSQRWRRRSSTASTRAPSPRSPSTPSWVPSSSGTGRSRRRPLLKLPGARPEVRNERARPPPCPGRRTPLDQALPGSRRRLRLLRTLLRLPFRGGARRLHRPQRRLPVGTLDRVRRRRRDSPRLRWLRGWLSSSTS